MQDIEYTKLIADRIEGWLTEGEGTFLYNTAKNCSGKGVILEIGSWKGKSTVWLAKGSKAGNKIKVYAVDPHKGGHEHKTLKLKSTFEEFKRNMRNARIDDFVVPIVKTSKEAAESWNKPIEFLWIDGSHKQKDVLTDFKKWEPFLVEGGVIAFDDTLTGGPKAVVDKHLHNSNKFKVLGFVNDTTFAKKVKSLSTFDRVRNKYILLLKTLYYNTGKLNLPMPLRKIGNKLSTTLQ